MTPSREISDEVLDRLVDGELPEAERRAVLLSLEGQPGEWRRCALAFLEAQTWKEALGDTVKFQPVKLQPGKLPPVKPQPGVTTVALPPRKMPFAWRTLLAVAASFIVAFSLGTAFNWLGLNRPGGEPRRNDIANLAPSSAPNAKAGDVVETNAADVPAKEPDALRLTFAGQGNEGQSVDVPVVNDARQLQALFAENLSVLPAYVRDRIERSGHRIEQHRELLPVELSDGRQVIVPVDQLNVNYVGGRSVQ